jgi:outer membrane protein assembly factor BamB
MTRQHLRNPGPDARFSFDGAVNPACPMHSRFLLLLFTALPLQGRAESAADLLNLAGIKGGIVVHVGLSDPALTKALRAGDSFQVQGLDQDAAKVSAAREAILQAGVYGPVSVDRWDGKTLPYVDNFVNLLISEEPAAVSTAEIDRVLVPQGVALTRQDGKWLKRVKSPDARRDDWTHYYYNAKGNAVSKDQLVGPPQRLQWVGNPRWSRHHDRMSSLSAQVSSNGRIFSVMDEGSRISILLPSKWKLIARDAYNGTLLWKLPIETWSEHMWPLKTGPTQLTRRLVAAGDTVFFTRALEGPVVALSGPTGEVIRTYEQTKGTEEILHVDGVLYLLVNQGKWSLTDYAPREQQDQKRVADEYAWDRKPRRLMAVRADTGETLWDREATVAPVTLASDGKHLAYYDGIGVICLDATSGKERWASSPAGIRPLIEYNFGPRVLLHENLVLYAGGDGAQKAYDLATGKELWKGSHEKSGYRSPEDLIVASGLVWNAGTTQGGQSGEFIGRDPKTGEVKEQFAPNVPEGTYWFHHRCYIAKATEHFILPSRTGIEYVDLEKQSWDLNHWVRGACLYGVLPANGLTYAGPHNCACYPEAKLDGINALSASIGSPHPTPKPDAERLEHGPAWGQPLEEAAEDAKDWPTYRKDGARSGFTDQALLPDLGLAWEASLPGPLSAVTIAAGKLFVCQVDAHTLHALDSTTGKRLWHFTAGARIDSPPTWWKGRVYFGGKDGWVYCLRGSDGALIWRFQAAPGDRRHGAWEQIESVWPVHGSVLVENGTVNCVAGRSMFLDGGLRFLRLDALTGAKLVEAVYDDRDPETGGDLQDRHMTLQMPVGLNDILSSDGTLMYLRSQKIDATGKRIDIGPVSGDAAQQGAAQKGENRHLFAPMGFLDDSWFHRSYWVYGKNFAGGHSGYHQAGKYTPEGRILVHDDKNVYGFARQAQYYKWTTTMEHELFSASKDAPDAPEPKSAQGKGKGKAEPAGAPLPNVKFPSEQIKIADTPLTVEAWVLPDGQDGLIASHGGARLGYALAIEDGRPGFTVRRDPETVVTAEAQRPLDQGWHHLVGVLGEKSLRLYVDGQLAAEAPSSGMISGQPILGLQLGAPANSLVGPFGRATAYTGLLDQFAVFGRALSETEIVMHSQDAAAIQSTANPLLVATFDQGNARDESPSKANGVLSGVGLGKGKIAQALWFQKSTGKPGLPLATGPATGNGGRGQKGAAPAPSAPAKGSFVEHQWARPVPIFIRGMALAGKTIFIAGPPDQVDEEYAFERMSAKDPAITEVLAEQDAALDGQRGAKLWSVSTETGGSSAELDLKSPPVWDGLAVARGRLYAATVDGKVLCFGKQP